jgi:hypothetical protein
MQFSNIKSAVLALTVLQNVAAHSGFSNFFVDGVDQVREDFQPLAVPLTNQIGHRYLHSDEPQRINLDISH